MAYVAAVEVLLARGADVEARDRIGRSVLMAASDGGHTGVVRALVARGALPPVILRPGVRPKYGSYITKLM